MAGEDQRRLTTPSLTDVLHSFSASKKSLFVCCRLMVRRWRAPRSQAQSCALNLKKKKKRTLISTWWQSHLWFHYLGHALTLFGYPQRVSVCRDDLVHHTSELIQQFQALLLSYTGVVEAWQSCLQMKTKRWQVHRRSCLDKCERSSMLSSGLVSCSGSYQSAHVYTIFCITMHVWVFLVSVNWARLNR